MILFVQFKLGVKQNKKIKVKIVLLKSMILHCKGRYLRMSKLKESVVSRNWLNNILFLVFKTC